MGLMSFISRVRVRSPCVAHVGGSGCRGALAGEALAPSRQECSQRAAGSAVSPPHSCSSLAAAPPWSLVAEGQAQQCCEMLHEAGDTEFTQWDDRLIRGPHNRGLETQEMET